MARIVTNNSNLYSTASVYISASGSINFIIDGANTVYVTSSLLGVNASISASGNISSSGNIFSIGDINTRGNYRSNGTVVIDTSAHVSASVLKVNNLAGGGILYNNVNGTVATDASNLYWDSSNIRLGVGTSSLNAIVHINSNNSGDSNFLTEKIAGQIAYSLTPWTNQIYIGAGVYYKSSAWVTQNNASTKYQLMSLYPGVGVTWFANGASSNPITDTVTLWNDSGSWVSKINSNNITGSLLGTSSYAVTASYVLGGGSPTSGISSYIGLGNITASVNTTGDRFKIFSGSTTQFYLSSSGNVGIGTTTPGAKLDVQGNILLTGYLVNSAATPDSSNMVGVGAGTGATNAIGSNFIGVGAGQDAVNASSSNFIGVYAGNTAEDAEYSQFIGTNAGLGAIGARFSQFIGTNAGNGASAGAVMSTFIGFSTGLNDPVANSVDSSSILIGNYASTNGYSNSVAIGQSVANSAARQINLGNLIFGNGIYHSNSPSAVPVTGGKVGIGISDPVNALDVTGNISCSVITASLFYGTASIAIFSVTADYALDSLFSVSASSVSGGVVTSNISSSNIARFLNITASRTISASFVTASNMRVTGKVVGTSSWADNSTNAITSQTASYIGEGTNRYFPIWESNMLTATSSIYQSGSFVGILTQTPRGTFDVNNEVEVGDMDSALIGINTVNTGGNMLANGKIFSYSVYAYKNTELGTVYSKAPAYATFTDPNDSEYFTIYLTWDSVVDATGYKIVAERDDAMGYNGDYTYTLTTNTYTTIFIDIGNVYLDDALTVASGAFTYEYPPVVTPSHLGCNFYLNCADGTAIQRRNLTVSQSLTVQGGVSFPIRVVSSSYSVSQYDYTIVVTGSTSSTITLPSANLSDGKLFIVKNRINNPLYINTSDGALIDEDASLTSSFRNTSVSLHCDGNEWFII